MKSSPLAIAGSTLLLTLGLVGSVLVSLVATDSVQAETIQLQPVPAQPVPKETIQAETALERIARTGILTAGTRTDAPPFAYVDRNGKWIGYSIEMLHLIQKGLEETLQRPVQLDLVPVNVADWVSKLEHGELDLVCGSNSVTTNRELHVDFSVGYFRTGTQFLIRAGRQLNPPELRVGVVRGASDEYPVEDQLRLARIVRFPNRAEGVVALNAGQIDALASDGILLEGLRQTLDHPDQFEIIPDRPFNPEVYGCALPQNDPSFRTFVNAQIIAFMQGVLNRESESVRQFETWFGPMGVAPVDETQIMDFFRQTIASYEQTLGNSIQN